MQASQILTNVLLYTLSTRCWPLFPHCFEVPVHCVDFHFSLSFLLVLFLEEGWLHEPMCNGEILHCAQLGQNVYMEYRLTI